MLKKFTICLVAFISLSLANSTFARSRISFRINIGAPVYVVPAPIYVAPSPGCGYYAPPPVIYYPSYRYPRYSYSPSVGRSYGRGYGYDRGHGYGRRGRGHHR